MIDVPAVMLLDGTSMPRLGLGTWPMDDAQATRAVSEALGMGYRLIDTAAAYGNEAGVGEGIAAAGVPREEIFVTTKLRGAQQGYAEALAAGEESRKRLGVDVIDLYLIHWPLPQVGRYLDSWRAMIELRERGVVRSIGVSNFTPPQIEHLVAETGVRPVVNQIELHPDFSQPELRSWHAEQGIVTEAWSPLGRTRNLGRPEIEEIAAAHGRSPAQIALRWHVQLDDVPIPKSANPERMRENLDVFDFELSEEEMARLDGLDRGARQGGDPDRHEEF
ncbi:MAG: aldo/keto reductase [Streptosporangiales bacterium]|nr:aldo/keto reductase [Streptosporangiales bacterium]